MGRAVELLGRTAVAGPATAVSRRRLRTIAYHEVTDPERFRAQISMIAEQFRPVGEREVIEAVEHGAELPPKAVWVTFDDGSPTVMERAQPVLDELGVPATIFVCPGLVDTDRPMWWDIVGEAERLGAVVPAPLVEIKAMPDHARRALVAELEDEIIRRSGSALTGVQLTTASLRRWIDAGHGVGNHSWDHPCLDTCTPAEQEEQIRRCHAWLVDELGLDRPTFAYPNGNRADATERTLLDLKYPVGLVFDHRLTRLDVHPMRLSRLRLSADASVGRARAILSGAHSFLFHATRRARGIAR
ncbi:MAG: polysaccharide deacetylase family protein [Actinomycetota bacterium]